MVFTSSQEAEVIPPVDLVSWLFDETPADPDKPLFIDAKSPEKSLSWAQIKTLVQQLAAGLQYHGLKPGDCLCVLSENNIYYYPTVYGCVAAGGIFAGASTLWTPEQCAQHLIAYAGATHFLATPKFLPHAVAVADANGLDHSRIFAFTGLDDSDTFHHEGKKLTTWSALLKHGEADWNRINDLEIAKSSISMRLTTSGTTGLSKMSQLSHHAAIAHVFQWCRSFKTYAFEVKSLYFYAMGHIGSHSFMTTALKLGFPVYILSYSIDAIRAACEAFEPTLISVDPHTTMQLVKTLPEGSQALECLRDVRIGGFDLPTGARKVIQNSLHPDCLVSRPYGGTEMGTVSAILYEQRENHDVNGVGYTYPGVQVKLIDDDKEITDFDVPGELLVKTTAMFTDYYNDPVATSKAFQNGWYVTGDVGYLSAKTQQWCLIGRKQYVLKAGGKDVSPEEVEAALVSNSQIADAGVAPLPAGGAGTLIAAFVVLKTAGALTESDILSYTESRLSSEKMITGGVHFVDKLPRNDNKKIIRWKLADMARALAKPGSSGVKLQQGHGYIADK